MYRSSHLDKFHTQQVLRAQHDVLEQEWRQIEKVAEEVRLQTNSIDQALNKQAQLEIEQAELAYTQQLLSESESQLTQQRVQLEALQLQLEQERNDREALQEVWIKGETKHQRKGK